MIFYEWIDFKTDTNFYTKETFEETVNDTFEALLFENGKDYPAIVWTRNYVILLKPSTRMYQDITFHKIARHPAAEEERMHFVS
ncbi:hypothetical protein SAMN04487944_117110 [Gracilibacillus ureilyticus]|uniref:Uncharacterized protein n=1 Tax=Gracilibacillus ureilyticus TaxID=531814 RepID=A0A1H9UI68_9BACI|nr:hypothetical protein [Gracilibacillus ureilyticus]SES08847.1 hypothetical protein SAMN04487944_117110 [Gracilibacillus ureilyticus]